MTENIHFTIAGNYQYKAYHEGICFQKSWHRLKFQTALDLLQPDDKDVFLDAACGSGILANLVAEKTGAIVSAVDFNKAAIDFCRNTYTGNRINFRVADLKEHVFADNSFSKIAMLEVIEHLQPEDAVSILRNLYGYLRPGGRLVISTPNKSSLWPLIEFTLDTFRLTPKMKDEQHVKLYNRASLMQVLQEAGFGDIHTRTSHFLAPWFSFLGQGFASKFHSKEQQMKIGFGSLLFAAATKRSS